MSSFEYFTTLLSIILGFALAGVVRALGRILVSSTPGAKSPLAAAWNIVLLIQITIYWVVLWRLFKSAEEISFLVLIVYTFGTVVLYLASFVLESKGQENTLQAVDDEGPGKIFFSCLAIHMTCIMGHVMAVLPFDFDGVLGLSIIVLCLLGVALRRRTHHFILVSLYLVNMVSIGLTNATAFAN